MTASQWKATGLWPRLSASFDEIHLVYDHLSGQTHCLNFLTYEMLRLAEAGSLRLDDLPSELGSRLGMDAGDFERSVLEAAISELARLGLIRPDQRASEAS